MARLEDPFFPNLNTMNKITSQSSDIGELATIIDEITNYDVYDFIARLSSLNLLIENQNKSILFDVLIAGLLTKKEQEYASTIRMSNSRFSTIINRLFKLGVRVMIDPAEIPFLERVFYYGNHWIFPGINYYPGYCLQAIIDVLCFEKFSGDESFFRKGHQLINFCLSISSSIAKALNYDLDTIKQVEAKDVNIPGSQFCETLKNCVIIDYSLFKTMLSETDVDSLFSEFGECKLEEVLSGEKELFFQHLFLLSKDRKEIILLNPSILASFTIHQIIVWAGTYGLKDALINAYNTRIWNRCQQSFHHLGHKSINETAYGITLFNSNDRREKILTAGTDKLLIVHYFCDDGNGYNADSMFNRLERGTISPSISERVDYFITHLPSAKMEKIYQIVIVNSFGRSIALSMSGKPFNVITLAPFELHCISINERRHEDFLPRYIEAKERIKTSDPSSVNGELNAIELYTANDYSFYFSDDIDLNETSVYIGIGDSLQYIIHAVKKEDRQLIDYYDSVRLKEIYLVDQLRSIYCTENKHDELPETVVRFSNIDIWLSLSSVHNNIEEIRVCSSVVDMLSYWLAEAKDLITGMKFNSNNLCIRIVLPSPIEEIYDTTKAEICLQDALHFEHNNNIITMSWDVSAYPLFGDKTNQSEKELILCLVSELEKHSSTKANYELLNIVFANPLKKKCYAVFSSGIPSLIPIDNHLKEVSREEENRLLDELGNHFLELPQYDVGTVPDDKRVELSNQVVGYLYTRLKNEITSINAEGIYERVIYDLEIAIYETMLFFRRYSYDIACYPEKKEEIDQRYRNVNKSSIAIKFLAEYISAMPPCGTNPIGSMQYDQIIAICSLIIDWAYKNDLFYYKIINAPVRFLNSRRIGISQIENEQYVKVATEAQQNRLASMSDPRVQRYAPDSLFGEFQLKIDDAFIEENGFSFQQFTQCVFGILDIGDTIKSNVKRMPRIAVESEVSKKKGLPVELVNLIINHISLSKREDFLIPPTGFRKEDVYPWRFNRELSFNRRPIIVLNNELIWGNRQLDHMWRFSIELIMEGKYKARSIKMRRLIGEISDKRGMEFNTEVANKLSSFNGLIVKERVSKINGTKLVDENNNDLGDIDVLCIIPEKHKIVVCEVKNFGFAKNPYEMNQEYQRLFVDTDKPCFMTKHKKRAAWVRQHIDDVKKQFSLSDGKWTVKPVMIVSEEIISNAYYKKGESILVYSNLTEKMIRTI